MAFLVDLTIKATVLLVAAALVVRLMRRDSAASRHAIWLGLFCSVALLPLAATVLPSLSIPVLPAATYAVEPAGSSQARHIQAPVGAPTPAPARVDTRPSPTRTRWPLAALIPTIWLIGAGLLFSRMAVGAAGVARLRRRAEPVVRTDVLELVEAARQRLRVRRPITVLSINDAVMPLTWGLGRPVVLLPSSAVSAIRPAGLEAIILHEVAHIARLDALTQLVSQLVTAALWFHPLMWMALRSARIECERACDDVALRHGIRPTDYAMELLMLVRALRPMNSLVLGVLGAARHSQLDRRIRRILSEGASRHRASRASVLTIAALLALACPLAAARLSTRGTARLPLAQTHVEVTHLAAEVRRPVAEVTVTSQPIGSREASARPSEVSPQTILFHETVQAEIPWHAERAELYQRLLHRAQDLLADCRTQIQIGTMVAIDIRDVQLTIDQLRDLAQKAAGSLAGNPTPTERAELRTRFANAQRTLDLDQTKFAVGLLPLRQFETDLIEAGKIIAAPAQDVPVELATALALETGIRIVVTDQPAVVRLPFEVKRVTVSDPNVARVTVISPREVQIEGHALGRTTLTAWGDSAQARYPVDVEHLSRTTADFESQLQFALTRPTDADRAEALLALARGTVFTAQMVDRYVTAVSQLSATERERVLAQPIRVRPSGG